jgi:hypothetical protein
MPVLIWRHSGQSLTKRRRPGGRRLGKGIFGTLKKWRAKQEEWEDKSRWSRARRSQPPTGGRGQVDKAVHEGS